MILWAVFLHHRTFVFPGTVKPLKDLFSLSNKKCAWVIYQSTSWHMWLTNPWDVLSEPWICGPDDYILIGMGLQSTVISYSSNKLGLHRWYHVRKIIWGCRHFKREKKTSICSCIMRAKAEMRIKSSLESTRWRTILNEEEKVVQQKWFICPQHLQMAPQSSPSPLLSAM